MHSVTLPTNKQWIL